MKGPAAFRTRVRLLLAVDGGHVFPQVAPRHKGSLALLTLEPAVAIALFHSMFYSREVPPTLNGFALKN